MNKKIKIVIIIFTFALLVINVGIIVIMNLEDKDMKKVFLEDETSTEESKMRITFAEGFYYEPISDEIKSKIYGKSYKDNNIIDYSDLRLVTVQYIGFDENSHQGELIVNVQVADDITAIFKELYDANYQIEKIRLVDDYDADDEASMDANNTSAFNFRQIDNQNAISDHSYGIAVDINPLYNPYVRTGLGDRDVLPVKGIVYANREIDFEHKISSGDICYNAFINRGWKWGGDWNYPKDYQHFYKEIY